MAGFGPIWACAMRCAQDTLVFGVFFFGIISPKMAGPPVR